MKKLFMLGLAVVAFAMSGVATADDAVKAEMKSGPQVGDSLGAFNVTKIAGAENDGVEEGKNLCYRCRNGAKPQVIVFTRSTDPKVTELVQKLDKAIEENESSKLRVFVNVMADDKDSATEEAKKFATSSKTKNIPFVVPNEFENGPDNYGVNAKAEVTVCLASDLGVKASHAVANAKDLNIESILSDLGKILN